MLVQDERVDESPGTMSRPGKQDLAYLLIDPWMYSTVAWLVCSNPSCLFLSITKSPYARLATPPGVANGTMNSFPLWSQRRCGDDGHKS